MRKYNKIYIINMAEYAINYLANGRGLIEYKQAAGAFASEKGRESLQVAVLADEALRHFHVQVRCKRF